MLLLFDVCIWSVQSINHTQLGEMLQVPLSSFQIVCFTSPSLNSTVDNTRDVTRHCTPHVYTSHGRALGPAMMCLFAAFLVNSIVRSIKISLMWGINMLRPCGLYDGMFGMFTVFLPHSGPCLQCQCRPQCTVLPSLPASQCGGFLHVSALLVPGPRAFVTVVALLCGLAYWWK